MCILCDGRLVINVYETVLPGHYHRAVCDIRAHVVLTSPDDALARWTSSPILLSLVLRGCTRYTRNNSIVLHWKPLAASGGGDWQRLHCHWALIISLFELLTVMNSLTNECSWLEYLSGFILVDLYDLVPLSQLEVVCCASHGWPGVCCVWLCVCVLHFQVVCLLSLKFTFVSTRVLHCALRSSPPGLVLLPQTST